jgi:hypothetical protein
VHTALIDGYVFEGHVPLDLVQKVLKERPKIAGLAVPGMPLGIARDGEWGRARTPTTSSLRSRGTKNRGV